MYECVLVNALFFVRFSGIHLSTSSSCSPRCRCFFEKKYSSTTRRVDRRRHGGPAAVRCGDLPLDDSDAIAAWREAMKAIGPEKKQIFFWTALSDDGRMQRKRDRNI